MRRRRTTKNKLFYILDVKEKKYGYVYFSLINPV